VEQHGIAGLRAAVDKSLLTVGAVTSTVSESFADGVDVARLVVVLFAAVLVTTALCAEPPQAASASATTKPAVRSTSLPGR
jgi:hypothetical protein